LVIFDDGISAGIPFNGIRADIVPGVSQTVPHHGLDLENGTPYLNPAAFTDPPLSPINSFALRPGNSPGFLPYTRGPLHYNEDFGIIKNTHITERTSLQFRADMFNVFNRVGLGDPDTDLADLADGTFGTISEPAHGGRIIQLALRFNF
jgi:hypothetical protein